jgi:hypothetical protein
MSNGLFSSKHTKSKHNKNLKKDLAIGEKKYYNGACLGIWLDRWLILEHKLKNRTLLNVFGKPQRLFRKFWGFS